jgi:protein TonB
LGLHLLAMTMILGYYSLLRPAPVPLPVVDAVVESAPEKVFLPRPEVLRQLAPVPPAPEAPSRKERARISIGAPDPRRAEELILRRDEDITSQPSAPGLPQIAPTTAPATGAVEEPRKADALPLPAGEGTIATGERQPPPRSRPSILSSLEGLEKRIQKGTGYDGLTSGATGKQMGPLFFDPEGADFTSWINHFKNEVYRNWIVPQAAYLGFRGQVDIEFTVRRDGTMTEVNLLKSSGTSALDRAAQNALLGSRLQPLPADYGPPSVTMKVSFHYGDGARRS